MAGIVIVSNFVPGAKKSYSGIIDYYERYEQKNENEFIDNYNDYLKEGGEESLLTYIDNEKKKMPYGNYINYMNKSKKSSGLFGDQSNHFSYAEKMSMKEMFNKGQENGSVLWGNVFSFDHEFLIKHELLNEKTGALNEIRIKEAVRDSIRVMMKEEEIDKSAVWCGEIHYDTDNIHVHTSIVEMKNTRPMVSIEKKRRIDSKTYEGTEEFELQPKAKIKKKTIDKMKSTFANKLIDRTKDLQAVSELRMKLHHSITIDNEDIKQRKLLDKIKEVLPEDKSKWQYNNKQIKNFQPLIDQYTENHLNKYHKHEYEEFKSLLNKEEEFYKETYGEGSDDRYKDYSKNKIKEIKSKMGNELLRELKKEDRGIPYQNQEGKKQVIRDSDKKFKMISREDYQKNYSDKNGKSKLKYNPPVNLYKVNKAIKSTFRNEKRNRELDFEYQQLQNKVNQDMNRQSYESEYGR